MHPGGVFEGCAMWPPQPAPVRLLQSVSSSRPVLAAAGDQAPPERILTLEPPFARFQLTFLRHLHSPVRINHQHQNGQERDQGRGHGMKLWAAGAPHPHPRPLCWAAGPELVQSSLGGEGDKGQSHSDPCWGNCNPDEPAASPPSLISLKKNLGPKELIVRRLRKQLHTC